MIHKSRYPQTKPVCDKLMFLHMGNNNPNSIVQFVGKLSLLYRASRLKLDSLKDYEILRWWRLLDSEKTARYTLFYQSTGLFHDWLRCTYKDIFQDTVCAFSEHDLDKMVHAVDELYKDVPDDQLGDVFDDFVFCGLAYNGYSFNHGMLFAVQHHQDVIPASPKTLSAAFEYFPVPRYGAVLIDPAAGTGSMIHALAMHGKLWANSNVLLSEYDRDGMVLSCIRMLMEGVNLPISTAQQINFAFDWKNTISVSRDWVSKAEYSATMPPLGAVEYYTTGDFREPIHPWLKKVLGDKSPRNIPTWMAVLVAQLNLLEYGGYGLIILSEQAVGWNTQNGLYQLARQHLFERADVQYAVELDPMEFQPFYKGGKNAVAVIYQKNDDGTQNGVTFIGKDGRTIYRTPDQLRDGHHLWPATYLKELKK